MGNRALWLIGIVAALLAAAVWTVAASWLFVLIGGLFAYFPHPWTTWWIYQQQPDIDRWTKIYLAISGVAAAIPLALIAILVATQLQPKKKLRRPRGGGIKPEEPGVTDNHGHSAWMDMDEAKRLFPGPDPDYGGIVVGEAYRVDLDKTSKLRFSPHDPGTWGMGGKAPLLIDPCREGSTHSIIFAGPGGFKSTTAISTILAWTGSSVILDPSQELGPMLEPALRQQGKRVFHVGLSSLRDMAMSGLNVLSWINPADPEAEKHILTTTGWIYDDEAARSGAKTTDPFFTNMGRNLVGCLMAHMIWDETCTEKSLAVLAEGLSASEKQMVSILHAIHEQSTSPLARRLAASLMECRAPETFTGVYMNAFNGIAWLMIGAYGDLVSGGGCDPAFLLDGNTTIFLNIGLQTLENTPSVGRVLVGALMNTVYMADGNLSGRVLFLLDEAARLGRMKVIETARDAGRKYGITIQLLMQSVGQLMEAYGRDGAKAWFDATSWIGYASVRAAGVGKELSEQLGTHGVLAYSEGENRGSQKPFGFAIGSSSKGSNTNVHEIKRPLMSLAELQQDMRADEIIIVPQSGMPIRCGRAIFFRRPEIAAIVKRSRFANGSAA